MDCQIRTATGLEIFVRGIHDRIAIHFRDILSDDSQRHSSHPFFEYKVIIAYIFSLCNSTVAAP